MFLSIKTDPRDCRIAPGDALTCGLSNIILNCEVQLESTALNMKRIITLITVIFLSLGATAQTVENIRVDQEGDNILVHYRIGGSIDVQTYNVTLSCSIDGGRRFEPKTVFGDVNENIRGGKSNYTITWDVFEDLEEVGEVEFFIKVDLVSDLSHEQKTTQDKPEEVKQDVQEDFARSKYLAYTGSTIAPLGISFGVAKIWGFYLSARYGTYSDDFEWDAWFTFVAGINRHIFSSGRYRLHAYVGGGVTYEQYDDYIYALYSEGLYFTLDAGIVNVIGRINLTLGVETFGGWATSPVFGVGYVF